MQAQRLFYKKVAIVKKIHVKYKIFENHTINFVLNQNMVIKSCGSVQTFKIIFLKDSRRFRSLFGRLSF